MSEGLKLFLLVFGILVFCAFISTPSEAVKNNLIKEHQSKYSPEYCDGILKRLSALSAIAAQSTAEKCGLMNGINYYITISEDEHLRFFLLSEILKLDIPLSALTACDYTQQNKETTEEHIVAGTSFTTNNAQTEEYLLIDYKTDNGETVHLSFKTKPLGEYEIFNEVAQRNVNLAQYVNSYIQRQ